MNILHTEFKSNRIPGYNTVQFEWHIPKMYAHESVTVTFTSQAATGNGDSGLRQTSIRK